jgi:uncharacterized protein involved in outer membrane biogenesis
VRILKWTVGIFALLVAGVFLTVVLTGLNPLRGPISRLTEAKTGRELLIQGNLKPVWSWVHPRIRAERISFANPPWAKEKYLITAEAVEVTLSVLPLFTGRVVLPEVHLEKPVVDLEQDAEGRKSWVLDDQPKKESRVHIHRLTLDHGELIYDDALADVSLRAALTTDQTGIAFTTKGKYHGLPLAAAGHGGPVLLLRGADRRYRDQGRREHHRAGRARRNRHGDPAERQVHGRAVPDHQRGLPEHPRLHHLRACRPREKRDPL